MPRASHRTTTEDRAALEVAAHLLATEPPFSRNKHYDAFRDPELKRALTLYRRVKALALDVERALDRAWTVRVVDGVYRGEPARQIVIEGPSTRRAAWLSPGAFELLTQRCPRIAAR